MNTLSRWNSWRDVDDMHRRLTSLFDLTPSLLRRDTSSDEQNITLPDWAPLVDIAEDDKEYLIKVELPEVQKEDVKVTVENGTLSVSGERKSEKEEKGKKYHRTERYYGRFERNFTIPEDADGSNIKAECKDGILKVHLAKSEKARPRQIEVKVN
jgi:HSP20 family protein